ncbi:hypothetical protein WDJ51_04885 [Rathayibacter sp. YIM 133350]|uniref:hypothetical protein n=1 Tax=Rathayibacter sp. YIM 133350 TaxID=3131992 RepID=UPI00307D608E
MEISDAYRVLEVPGYLAPTHEVVEHAYRQAVAARHPSLYPEGEGRAAAESWMNTLSDARALLLSRFPAPTPVVAAPKKRLSPVVVIGIVAASVVLALVVVYGAFAVIPPFAAGFAEGVRSGQAGDASAPAGPAAPAASEPGTDDSAQEDLEPVQHWSADENGFSSRAAVDIYNDNRLANLCLPEFLNGCWQMSVIPEAACSKMEVSYSFSNDADSALAAETRSEYRTHVDAGEVLNFAFGNDTYDYAWISDVSCIDSAPPIDGSGA